MDYLMYIYLGLTIVICVLLLISIFSDPKKKKNDLPAQPVVNIYLSREQLRSILDDDSKVNQSPKKEAVLAPKPQVAPAIVPLAPTSQVNVPIKTPNVVVKNNVNERYQKLSRQSRGYFDHIDKYAAELKGVKCLKKIASHDFKIGHNLIVKLLIKKGQVYCQFLMIDQNFKHLLNDSKKGNKPKLTDILVNDDESLHLAIESIDMSYQKTLIERMNGGHKK